MALPFSLNTDKQEQRKAAQRQNEFSINQKERQKVIRNTVTNGVDTAVRRIKYLISDGRPGRQVNVQMDFWTARSAFMLHDYRKVDAQDLDLAIRIDVDFLLGEVARLDNHYREWKIEAVTPKGHTFPNQISVRKK